MDEQDRAAEIARLHERLAALTSRKAALVNETHELVARLHDIRAAFGNPFYYSHPKESDEGAAHYTGRKSHEVMLGTVFALKRVDGEIEQVNNRLAELGATVDR